MVGYCKCKKRAVIEEEMAAVRALLTPASDH